MQQDGESVFYLGTVTGAVLDACVNETRSGFELPEEANLSGEPTQAQIAEGVVNKVKAYLQPHLEALAVRKRAMVDRVINEAAPELRIVVARHGELLERLAVDSSKQEVLAVVSGRFKPI